MTVAISIVLADDHPIVLDGLEQLFRTEKDFDVKAKCRDGEQALRAVREHRPDILVLDVRMPIRDGLSVLRELRNWKAATRVVLLTVAIDEEQLTEALALGTRGILLKETAPNLLLEAVREVHKGGQWIETGVVGRTLKRMRERDLVTKREAADLTPRELQIVRMVAGGHRNRAISDELGITEGTVKIHLHNIYQKLRVDGRLELAVLARERGLLN